MTLPGLLWLALVAADSRLPTTVEYNRDIRPILSDNCYACHGPDKNVRKADLRLDTSEGAHADRGGYAALAPGKPNESELLLRVLDPDAKRRMPPAKFGKKPTPHQVALLRRWIEQGAAWQPHWSLLPPTRAALPAGFAGNPIDHFIRARLDQENLQPAAEADRRMLLRRLAFDLTGLPPTAEQLETFLADTAANAYDRIVEQLLASPHYGERMALYWLDLVRYADTGGYHSDNHRDVALYRDYVIEAFNRNKPFDRFTVEQLAGDLLTGATREQRIGSGYNRLLQTTEEGGAQPKEYAAKYAADRVRNVSTVWLGTTLGCSECHDHKFDPFSTREFYRFASFFADVKEKPVGRQDQDKLPTEEQAARLRQLDEQIAAVRPELDTQTPDLDAAQVKWEADLRVPEVRRQPKNIVEILLLDPAKRTDVQKQALSAHYRTLSPLLAGPRQRLAELQRQRAEFEKNVQTSLVSTAVPPRMMRVLPRGNWLDDSGEVVAPGVPAALGKLELGDRRATRLDLAQWLVAPKHPLTARVFVNRLWMLFFGQGLVKSLDDFGSQGTWPSHPALLDWLAVEFQECGWDVKRLIKLMVTSRTYRQSSQTGDLLRQRDPYNELLARQARFRLDAEMVRDNALSIGGLLARDVGGPSVKPYQPAGYWALLNFPKREWQNDHGVSLYRRGLYTYWCRTFLHPSLAAFDAPSREECTVERPRSNTPLQALVLLNDPIYVEAARAFAERILREGGRNADGRIQFAYRAAVQRPARPEEVRLLTELVENHQSQYRAEPPAALALLRVGERPAAGDLDPAELAAWTSVARVLLNLHETITRD